MNLTFLNPLFLVGLTAGVIPVLIHRLTKRNAASRKFSAVRLLLTSQQTMARPQRLRHLLLLALRILAVLSAVLVLARPLLTSPGTLAKEGETALVILLDNSMSMGYREEGGDRFSIAKKAARERVQECRGKVLLVPTGSAPLLQAPDREPRWMAPEEALQELGRLHLSWEQGNPEAALRAGYQKLKELKIPGEIVILSDWARWDWEGFDLGRMEKIPGEVPVTILRIGGAMRDPNVAIREVRLPERENVIGVPMRIEAVLANLSDRPESPRVELHLNRVKREQKIITIRPGEEDKVFFEFTPEQAEWVHGEIRLSEDPLSPDNVYYFPFRIRDKIRVLLVDGDPGSSLRAGESYYLARALNPKGGQDSPFSVRVMTESELAGVDVKPYDALFFLNVAAPPASKLTSFLEHQKPVFFFLGDRVIPDAYHQIPLFPWRIRGVRESSASRPEGIGEIDLSLETLRSFSGPSGESLRKAGFQRYVQIGGGGKSLLTLKNQSPLLSEANLGKGKIYLFASSADLDWNDLPLKAAYLPLLQGLLKEAVRFGQEPPSKVIRVGEPFVEKGQATRLAGPEGEDGPGIYQVVSPGGEVRYGRNSPFKESDLTKVTPEEMKKRFGSLPVDLLEYREGALRGGQRGRRELWPYLLTFLLILLGVEMVVANWIPKEKEGGRGFKTERTDSGEEGRMS